jgi:hypothetical protein
MTLPEELAFTRLSYGNKYHKAVPGYMKRIRDLYEERTGSISSAT